MVARACFSTSPTIERASAFMPAKAHLVQPPSYKPPVFATLLARLIIYTLLSGKSNLVEAHASVLPLADNAKAPTTTYYVRRIILAHAQYLSKQAQRKLVAPYVNTFLSTLTIQQLIRDIRAYYLKQGYPTVQVHVVLGQSIQAGTLRLKIIHGFVEQINLGTNSLRDKLQLATAFPFVQGKPLYLPYLEQGIDQLNTLAANHATMTILPGKLGGGSIIQISNTVVHPWRIDIGLDNLGEEASGQLRGKLNLALDNLLSINDNFMFHYSLNKAKQVRAIPLFNQAFMATFSFPCGAYNFASTYNTSTALTPVKPHSYTYLYKTKTSSIALQVKRIIARHRSHKLCLQLGCKRNHTASFIEDTHIANQSRKLTSCQGGLSYTGIIGGGKAWQQ